MKPAVIMMFRDEADILEKCLLHWYALGVRNFYLCDNGSVDRSKDVATTFLRYCGISIQGQFIEDYSTDWPGRRVINDLKNRALADGCDWIFPADADEFLVLPEQFKTIQEWLEVHYRPGTNGKWAFLKYLNIYPNGREEWQEPHKKCFGLLTPEMTISMGNHLIEGGIADFISTAYYKHYSLRAYPQFRRKMENYMVAFSQNGFPDHHHAESYRRWQVEGETYLRNLWTELTGLPCE